jgi:hypothetical protein
MESRCYEFEHVAVGDRNIQSDWSPFIGRPPWAAPISCYAR